MKILIIAAIPRRTLHLDRRVGAIRESLLSRQDVDLRVVVCSRLSDVRREFLDFEPHVVQFVAPIDGAGNLILGDDRDRPRPVDSSELASVLRLFSRSVRCVVLPAGFQGLKENVSSQGSSVVVLEEKISDTTTIEFMVGFYDALVTGIDVPSAFRVGTSAARFVTQARGRPPATLLVPGEPPEEAGEERAGPRELPDRGLESEADSAEDSMDRMRDGGGAPPNEPARRIQSESPGQRSSRSGDLARRVRGWRELVVRSFERTVERLKKILSGDSTRKQRWAVALDRLDHRPFGRMLVFGLLAGVGLGFLVIEWGAVGWALATCVATAAALVGWTAHPVWVDEDAAAETPLEPGDLFDMVRVPDGVFFMGSPSDEPGRFDDEHRHEVVVSSFDIAATTVTRAQFAEILGLDRSPGDGGPDHPVTEISWREAVEFCNRASKRAGFGLCYHINGDSVRWSGGDGYRLPTEAEWEYAARAGTGSPWSFGDDESKLSRYAWHRANSKKALQRVATREPNPWGLFDMHGNVFEWCWDLYGEYPRQRVQDPSGFAGESSSTALRVIRGGSFWGGPRWLRSARRSRDGPERRLGDLGFRCVRGSRPQP